jgi:hypothetical protein
MKGSRRLCGTLREKITIFKNERTSLLVEIEKLKKIVDACANALENEVNQLREEPKSLREFLNDNEED